MSFFLPYILYGLSCVGTRAIVLRGPWQGLCCSVQRHVFIECVFKCILKGVLTLQGWKVTGLLLKDFIRTAQKTLSSSVINPTVLSLFLLRERQTKVGYVLQRISDVRSCNHFGFGRAITITYSECVFVALVTQHANRTRRVILSSVACPTLQSFSTIRNKRYYFQKTVTGYKMRVLISPTTFVWKIRHHGKDWAKCYHKCT